jgi:hypothetical protein
MISFPVYGISERCCPAVISVRHGGWPCIARPTANFHTRSLVLHLHHTLSGKICGLEVGAEFDYCLVIAGETIDNRSAVLTHKFYFCFVA